jgi:hypothetical protein
MHKVDDYDKVNQNLSDHHAALETYGGRRKYGPVIQASPLGGPQFMQAIDEIDGRAQDPLKADIVLLMPSA